MLKTIMSLFGRSPFAPLQSHMAKVENCVKELPGLFQALEKGDHAEIQRIGEVISDFEHQADLLKNDIRNHLPTTLYLPIDRARLLEILSLQDNIADKTEDVAVLVSLKNLVLPPSFKIDFELFLLKNIEAFDAVKKVIHEIGELIESSFGGAEAEKVRLMVDDVAYKEHEVDLIQRRLLKHLFNAENEMTYTTFFLWQKIFSALSDISNLAEKLANRVRMTLEVK